ncbi:type II toxin-antitoxin system VapB family antitoxin [Paraburkholderia acidicola]|uniref:Type II toxin-antitoxin system VapB family antitoxin n=1 Tax=Paraburkholderia acidicola TaxID=1912599 RepID=A0ABV1LL07_9BURK
MKTTLDLNEELVAEAKALAVRQHSTLTRIIEEGLQLRLRAQRTPGPLSRLPVFRGKGGLAAGVDGSSNRSMLEAADHDS